MQMIRTKDWFKKGKELLEQIQRGGISEKELVLWYLGQAGFAVAVNKTRIFIDPVFDELRDSTGWSRRCFPAPFTPEEATFADYIFCTHEHGDHMNMETILPINNAPESKTIFVVPAPYKEKLVEAGVAPERVIAAKAGEAFSVGDLRCVPVAAAHESYETDAEGNYLCLGYHFSFEDHSGPAFFHAGDTVLTRKLVDDVLALGDVDVMMLPINGADLKRREKNIIGNMNPRDAADFSWMAKAKLTIPYHYDMFAVNQEDPLVFADVMECHYSESPYAIPRLGQRIIYRKD